MRCWCEAACASENDKRANSSHRTSTQQTRSRSHLTGSHVEWIEERCQQPVSPIAARVWHTHALRIPIFVIARHGPAIGRSLQRRSTASRHIFSASAPLQADLIVIKLSPSVCVCAIVVAPRIGSRSRNTAKVPTHSQPKCIFALAISARKTVERGASVVECALPTVISRFHICCDCRICRPGCHSH